jgi:sialate O-acetylesterase
MFKHVCSLFALAILLGLAACKTQHAPEPSKTVVATAKASREPAPAPTQAPTVPPGPPVELQKAPMALRLPHIFSDNMVLQQGMNVPVWGWGKNNETVTVTLGGTKASAIVRDGKWIVKLHNLKSAEAETFSVTSGTESLQFTNVLVGEVWLCSGQSNMEWPLNKAFEPQNDIASATNTLIRLFVVPNVKSDVPRNDVDGKWVVCSPDTASTFSAVGYYFGRDLQAARKCAVGLIQSDWGGTPVESWTSHEGLAKIPAGKEVAETFSKENQDYTTALADYEKQLAESKRTENKKAPVAPRAPHKPSELFNGMIAPIIPYTIKGAIWYQGENNAGRAAQYRSLFPNMIRDWRRLWNEDFTFCCVQLAPFKARTPQAGDSEWAELREAQLLATRQLPKVGMAVITDVGEERDIHPRKKGPVGQRLALAARAIAYSEKVPYSGPTFRNLKIAENKAILKFDNVGGGLMVSDGALKSFALCGADHKWVWGIADIEGTDTVVVSSPNIESPVAVRFGWSDYPVVNLWNKDGLPASPFRTDNFPMITEGKK